MRIAVLDDYLAVTESLGPWGSLPSETTIKFFTEPIPPERRAEVLADFDVLVLMRERMPLNADLVSALPSLKLVVTTGARNASIDVSACRERGIPVLGTRSMSAITAETTWLLILGLIKRLRENNLVGTTEGWQRALPDSLEGQTIGVVGLGSIGRRVAQVANGFGMEVLAWSQNMTGEQAAEVGARHVDKDTLFQQSDIVTLHLRLSARTRHIVQGRELEAMKPSAFIVNTSRAGLIEEEALLEALQNGRIAGAGLDVFSEEPLPHHHILRQLPNVMLTPHLGYVTRQNFQVYFQDVVENILAWREGRLLRDVSA